MAKQITQFRFYGDKHENNYPTDLTKDLLTGSAFKNCCSIIQLGIQTFPGVKFYLNNNLMQPIMVGSTGIYELNVEGYTTINALSFSGQSLEKVFTNNPHAYLIIDIISETGGESV